MFTNFLDRNYQRINTDHQLLIYNLCAQKYNTIIRGLSEANEHFIYISGSIWNSEILNDLPYVHKHSVLIPSFQ